MKLLCLILTIVLSFLTQPVTTGVVGLNYRYKLQKADFRIAYSIIRNYEGNYGNMLYDRGGETYAGIVKKWSPSWYGWRYVNKKYRIHNEFVPEAEHWVQDYYLTLWVRENFNEIYNQRTANYLFEFRILSNKSSIYIIQQSLVLLGQKIIVDNKLGEETIQAINRVDQLLLLKIIRAKRVRLYAYIIQCDSTQEIWRYGWMKRAVAI